MHMASLKQDQLYQKDNFCNSSKFSSIFKDNTNIVVIKRELGFELLNSVDNILDNPKFRISKVVYPSDVNQFLIKNFNRDLSLKSLFNDISRLVNAFCNLFDLKSAWLRLESIDHQMCPRFHVDYVKCRMVTTYKGPATEWLPNNLVDRSKLGPGNKGLLDEESGLFLKKSDVKQLDVGDIALLKGGAWKGNEDHGLVHRSPYQLGIYKRLYMTIDFPDIFVDVNH